MKTKIVYSRQWLSIPLLVALSACGFVDSGGSPGFNIDPNNRIENENVAVVLDATVLVEAPSGKTFSWMQLDGPPVQLTGANTPRARFTTPVIAQRTVLVFTLTATDEFGAPESENVTITVNDTPTANAGADQSGQPNTSITLNGAASRDSDGSLTYAWQQTGGPPVGAPTGFDTAQPSFTVPLAPVGTALEFRLIVTDDNGASARDTVTVTVLAVPPPVPPTPPTPPPVDPDPIDPGPIDPGPIDPGPIDPGPIDPGPIDPDPVDPGPVDPGPIDPGPINPGPIDPGPIDPVPPLPPDDDDDADADDGDDDDSSGIFDGIFGASAAKNQEMRVAPKFAAASGADTSACWMASRGRRTGGLLPSISATDSKRVLYRLAMDAKSGDAVIVDATVGRVAYTPHAGAKATIDRVTYRVIGMAASQPRTLRIIYRPRVMTLGGSLTAGVVDAARQLPPPALRAGYRQPLARLLTRDGYELDLVGSQRAGFAIANFDADTETRAGWSLTELAYGKRGDGTDGVYGWLSRYPAEVVLLQLERAHLREGPAGMVAIVDEIDRWQASPGGNPVTVVLGGPVGRASSTPASSAFNAGIKAMVAGRAGGAGIILVDHSLDYPAGFGSPAYPNLTGYRKMAQTWLDALIDNRLLRKCP